MMLLLAAAALVAAVRIADLLLVAFIAVLLAVYLSGFTDHLCRWARVPRLPGLILALAATLAALTGIGFLLAPAVAQQTEDLIAAVPTYLTALDAWVRRVAASSEVLRRTGIAEAQSGLVTSALTDAAAFLRKGFFAYAAGTGRLLIDIFAVIAMSLYLAWRPFLYTGGIMAIVPPRFRGLARDIVADLGATLRAWVGAQLLAMVVLALTTGVGLWLLDVPYWLAFAIFTGVAVMVPFFGTITSTLLPALLVLPDRGVLGSMVVASLGIVVHLVEANVVHPLLMQHRVALPPALTILSVLVMGAVAGLLGMLVAVPALATVIVLLRHVVIFHAYGEHPDAAVPHAVLRPSRASGQHAIPA
jgi:predicted PurR-regulated permease PerM